MDGGEMVAQKEGNDIEDHRCEDASYVDPAAPA
jgi:hypothetical protein